MRHTKRSGPVKAHSKKINTKQRHPKTVGGRFGSRPSNPAGGVDGALPADPPGCGGSRECSLLAAQDGRAAAAAPSLVEQDGGAMSAATPSTPTILEQDGCAISAADPSAPLLLLDQYGFNMFAAPPSICGTVPSPPVVHREPGTRSVTVSSADHSAPPMLAVPADVAVAPPGAPGADEELFYYTGGSSRMVSCPIWKCSS